jgi:lysophospholipase L1-like esterase
MSRRFVSVVLTLLVALSLATGSWSAPAESPQIRLRFVRVEAPAAQVPGDIVCDGDSMTAGFGLQPSEFYPTVLANNIDAAWDVTNTAVTGRNIQQMIDAAPASVDVLYGGSGQTNIIVILGGSNDVATGTSSSTILSRLATYVSDRRAVGWSSGTSRIAFGTIPPNGGLSGAQETVRQTVNTALRANAGGIYGDILVDFAADPRLDDALDTTYYFEGDRLHWTAAGAAVAAELVEAAVIVPSPSACWRADPRRFVVNEDLAVAA